ncbi:MAG TPA: FAD-binding oxidoreductase [Verrucomicrobiae bacterium]|jgi:glycolate oxidase FAD binding subunit|nr:FAD-binding oxidoreductase [Verrucomicrobiae bacterium]
MSTVATNVAARLEAVISAAHVNGDPEFCAKFSVDGVVPSAVAKPASPAEVVEIVRFAKSEKLALIPCGRGTKLGMGMPPARYDIALNMTGLNQIAYYDPGDLTLSVDAGMSLTELSDALAQQKQFAPLAVPFFEECTVGGTIASNIGSSLRPGYGSARDFLLGAEFVNGAGTFTKSGGRVVKNVTGYDLHKLLIGSLGTLGAITRLNFRTFPLPEGHGHVMSTFSSVDSVARFQAMVAKSPLTPSSFDILGPEAAHAIAAGFRKDRDAALPSWFTHGAWHACVGFEGAEPILRRYPSELVHYAQQCGASSYHLLGESDQKSLRVGLTELIKLLSRGGPTATMFKINTVPGFSADVSMLDALAARFSIPCCIFANSSGPLYCALQPGDLNDKTIGSLAHIASGVFEYAAAHNGSASILFCPTSLKRVVNIWGPARNDAALMRRVKSAFDPENVFAPGRFVAGI